MWIYDRLNIKVYNIKDIYIYVYYKYIYIVNVIMVYDEINEFFVMWIMCSGNMEEEIVIFDWDIEECLFIFFGIFFLGFVMWISFNKWKI